MTLLKKFKFTNFYGFENIEYSDHAPINLIIGKNDSGKTGLLKLIYATTKTLVEQEKNHAPELQKDSFRIALSKKIRDTFTPRKGGLGDLVTKGGGGNLEAEFLFEDKKSLNIYFGFSGDATKEIKNSSNYTEPFCQDLNCIFIPAKEVLSVLKSIELIKKYNLFEFDDTYFDLVDALNIPTQKGRVADSLKKISEDLEKLFEGSVEQTLTDNQNPYIFKKGKSKFAMPQTAEGIKKIGILTTLFRNRQLNQNTVLIMDEPETTLHPKAQRQLADMLFRMSKEKIQIFIATHSYFLINEFCNIARREKAKINCLSIETKNKDTNRMVTQTDLSNGMPDNAIVMEALEMFKEDTIIELGL